MTFAGVENLGAVDRGVLVPYEGLGAVVLYITLVGRESAPDIVVELALCGAVPIGYGELPSLVDYVAHITQRRILYTHLRRNREVIDEVLRFLVVIIDADFERVVEHCQVQTGTGLYGGLPACVRIGDGRQIGSVMGRAADKRTVRVDGERNAGRVGQVVEVYVADLTPACTEFHEVEDLVETCILEEFLRGEFPRSRNGREPVVVLCCGQFRRCVPTDASGEEIAVVERIAETGEERDHRVIYQILVRVLGP